MNIKENLDSIVTQFRKLGLTLDLTQQEVSMLCTKARQCINPDSKQPYYTHLGAPLLYYLFEPTRNFCSEKIVLLLGGIHPDEIGPLYTVWKLLIQYLTQDDHSKIKNKIIYIPLLNPDCFISSGEDYFIPTRKKRNGIDLNRTFYNPEKVTSDHLDFQSEPEIEFLLQLINTYDPSHYIVMHSPLNLLELDGVCTKEDRNWINRVQKETGRFGGDIIPIKKFETYAEQNFSNWSFGHFIKTIKKTALTIEFPKPKFPINESNNTLLFSKIITLDKYYRPAVQVALDINGENFRYHEEEESLIKTLSPKKLAEYAHNHYGHPSKDLFVIGITGTNGKTTVSYLIGEVLKEAGLNPYVLGTLNSGHRDLSTPESIDILKIMRSHLDHGGTHFIMEVTSEGIDQARILGIDFNVKLLTNITPDHLDYHKTFENYQKVKMSFMSEGHANKIYPKEFKKETIEFKTNLLGEYNFLNIQAAVSILRYMSISEKYIRKTLTECAPPSGRLESIDKGQSFLVLVDYAHTSDGLKNLLNTVKDIAIKRNGRLLVLFGCGGNRDPGRRFQMGMIASQIADYLVVTDDNPRLEDSHEIMNDILNGLIPNFCDYVLIQNRKKAIQFIINKAHNRDVVILAGKGHETYQILKDKEIHFDDREEAEEAILNRLKMES